MISFVKRLFLEYLSAPCHSISLWCDVSQQTYDFLGSTNAVLLFPLFGTPWWRFSKGWSLKTVHFSGIFGIQLIINVQWLIPMASSVSKNLYKSLKISNQIECPESGMSRSNSKKSHVDVQTLGWIWGERSRPLAFIREPRCKRSPWIWAESSRPMDPPGFEG